jgi:hypothetical protein
VAVDAMDAVAGSLRAKREMKGVTKEDIVKDVSDINVDGAEAVGE